MQNFVAFWSDMLGVVSSFLLSEPIVWFVGCFVLIFILGFLQKLLNIK